VTSVDSAPSHDASTRLVFSTPYASAMVAAVAAVAATQCLHEAVDAHNGTGGQRKVRLVDEPAVRKVASPAFALLHPLTDNGS
jgi:hypothetical protein